MTLDSLKKGSIHTFLIEEIIRKLTEMGKISWEINFCCDEAYVGIRINGIADPLAREAAANEDITECYQKVPKSVVKSVI